jgi:hypothetical protein
MSGTTSAALRFEDHFGPIVPVDTPPAEHAPTGAAPAHEHAARLRDLAHQMRHCVVTAVAATDAATKHELWASYGSARAEALALVAPVTADLSPRRLHSV